MSIFDDFDEYEKMGQARKKKPHLKNLERERLERERERDARSRCMHPRCPESAEPGLVGSEPSRPWIGTGLCVAHFQQHLCSEESPHLKKRATREFKRAVYAERQEWSGDV